jgi:hypothetical protein
MSMEALIEIDSATEGMVLAKPLLDAGGSVLLPQGSTLTSSSLASLRRRGIDQLQVLMPEPEVDNEAAAAALRAQREQQCRRLDRLFRASADDGATGQLLERLRAYRKGE